MLQPILFYLPVGSGHLRAAIALQQAFQMYGYKPILYNALSNQPRYLERFLDRINRFSQDKLRKVYNILWWSDFQYSILEKIGINVLKNDIVQFLRQYRSKRCVIIATHALPCLVLSRIRGYVPWIRGVYCTITDFDLHYFWPLDQIDGYFVHHEDIAKTLVYRGVSSRKVFISGIPIDVSFEQYAPYRPYFQRLRLLFVVGGIKGMYYKMRTIIKILNQWKRMISPSSLATITIVTGNDRIARSLQALVPFSPSRVVVLGKVTTMHTYMARHNILLTKPGGLILSEALAIGQAVLLTRSGSGQERANEEFLARYGAARLCETPARCAQILQTFYTYPEQLKRLQRSAKALGKPYAARKAVRFILDNTR